MVNTRSSVAEAKALITRLKGYYDEGLFVTKGTLPNNTYTSTKFVKEELIMSIGSTGGTSYNIPAKDSDGNYLFDVKVAAIPQANPANPKVISQGPSIVFFKIAKCSDETSEKHHGYSINTLLTLIIVQRIQSLLDMNQLEILLMKLKNIKQ